MRDYYRKGRSSGLAHTRTWLEKWYGKPFDLRLEVLEIDCGKYLSDHGKTVRKLIENEHGRQSDYHKFLKAMSQIWLRKSEERTDKIRTEARCFVPNEVDDGRPDSKQPKPYILPRKSRILLTDGDLIVIDMLTRSTSVEVGFTTPYNLLIPLLGGIVDTAVWIPYCSPHSPDNFDLADVRLTKMPAYRVVMN